MVRFLAVVSGAAIACQSTSSGGLAGVSAEIGPEGGTLVASDGTRVDVPGGALPATVTLTLQPAWGAPAPSGAAFVSSPWTLEPEWLEFAQPITVTFPVDRAQLDAGPVVLTTAHATDGYVALAASAVDATHVAARSTHFATGAVASTGCPATCTTGADPVGQTLRCSATCAGHRYLLSCSGPSSEPSSCTCAIDGVVTSAMRVDTGDGGAGESIYSASCDFPSSAWK